ncbi:MAG: pitrilysin family protein [Planctomycetales bacterium]|nr:pitrilysin family protein [Planctomycetales bacterium]
MQFHQTTLPNGLEVVAELNDDVFSVAFGFYVRAGARDEFATVSGVSHFLEHMAFKGTERFSAEDVNRIFDEIGADNNAMTSEESTVFYAATLPEYLPKTFEVQSSILFPTLRQDDFDMEKKVILEEIGMYEDQPASVAYDRAMQLHFAGHPLGQSVLGTTESVSALTSEQMRGYHAEHYRAGNIVLAVAGRTEWSTVLELAQKHCGHWPSGGSPRTPIPAQSAPSTKYIVKECQQQLIIQMAAAPSGSDPRRFAAELLCVIVGDDTNSRLYWDLVDPALAESAEVGYYEYEGVGTYLTFLSGSPESMKSNLEQISRQFAAVNANGVTAEELEQARNKVATRVVLRGERPMGRLSSLGGNWLSRREYRSIADDLAILRGVTVEDIQQLLIEFPLAQTTTVGVGPLSE